jgi:chromosome segregation ATPase
MTQPLDLEKKSRELDEREESLKRKESLLEREKSLERVQALYAETETKVTVLNKQIKAKRDILQAHTDELDTLSAKYQEESDRLHLKEDSIKKSIAVQEAILSKAKVQGAQLETQIKRAKTELLGLQNQVRETKDYNQEQSKLAEDTIAQWNSDLVAFRKEADNIQFEKNKLSADIIRLEQDKSIMIIEASDIERKIEALDNTYASKVEEYKSNLRTFEMQKEAKQREFDSLSNSYDMRLKEVETREKSVRLKEGSINTREHELDQKERRLKMNYGMAGIDYEDVV